MKITDIRATTVTVPLEAPLRHANGCHWGRFVRTIVEVETDNGIVGLGEMGGGGESAEAGVRAMKGYLLGHDPTRLEEMRFLIANPTASLYNNRTQILAALEFACLDILGQAWSVPVCDILGGRLRDRVPFAAYCFFRYPNPQTGAGEIRTIDQVIANAGELKRKYGFTTCKMKAGVFHPDYELEGYQALAAAYPGDRLRFDPNAVWSTEQAIRFGQGMEGLRKRLSGGSGLRAERHATHAADGAGSACDQHCRCEFRAARREYSRHGGRRDPARHHVLGRHSRLRQGGGRLRDLSDRRRRAFFGELGIQLATMLHLGAVIPNLSFAADAHYHHLTDDIIEGGLMRYEGGAIAVPTTPGLGVKLNRDKLRQYSELYQRLGGYPYDQDPGRPGWTPIVPNDRWADPKDARPVTIPF
jgi:glucarate dehydratase